MDEKLLLGLYSRLRAGILTEDDREFLREHPLIQGYVKEVEKDDDGEPDAQSPEEDPDAGEEAAGMKSGA